MRTLLATLKLWATEPACGNRTPSGTCPCAWHELWRETAPAGGVYADDEARS